MWTALITTLISVVASLGLEKLVTHLDSQKADSDNLSADDIVKDIKSVTAAAKNKGQQAINLLNNRLSALQLPYSMSPAVKDALINARRDLTRASKQYTNAYMNTEAKLNNIEERASNLAIQDPTYRTEWGTKYRDRLIKETNDAVSEMPKLEKGVEQNV